MPRRPPSQPDHRPLHSIAARAVDWLWPRWIPLGKVAILDGDPGVGKSTILLDLAARLSRDGRMPDGAVGKVGTSLILSAEDGEADTIRPRLEAAGGVLDRVFVLPTVRDDDGEARPPELPRDLEAVETAVEECGACLVVIDPLMAFLTRIDASRDQDVRRALHKLTRVAERQNAAVVCLRHLNRFGDKAIYRGGGSIGIVAAARSGLLIAADPDDPQSRLLAATKCNLAAPPRPLRFRLEPQGGVCRVVWHGGADYEADDLVRKMSHKERTDREEIRCLLQEAMDFLRDFLASGPKPRSQCYLMGQVNGYSRRTMERAVKALDLRTRFGKDNRGEASYLLPPEPAPANAGGLAGES